MLDPFLIPHAFTLYYIVVVSETTQEPEHKLGAINGKTVAQKKQPI